MELHSTRCLGAYTEMPSAVVPSVFKTVTLAAVLTPTVLAVFAAWNESVAEPVVIALSLKRITGEKTTPFVPLFPRRMQEGALKTRPIPVHPETSVPEKAVSSVAPFKSLDASPVAPHPALKVEKFSNKFVVVAALAGAQKTKESNAAERREKRAFMAGDWVVVEGYPGTRGEKQGKE